MPETPEDAYVMPGDSSKESLKQSFDKRSQSNKSSARKLLSNTSSVKKIPMEPEEVNPAEAYNEE